jgi:cardiolipin synthase (CMP-forming)
MRSVIGTILDPAADKALMTTLTITLTIKGLLPGVSIFLSCSVCLFTIFSVPLAVVILGRDVLLSLSAFYIRYTSLPYPVGRPLFVPWYRNLHFRQKTFSRYWDFSVPSAEVRPTNISKVCSITLPCNSQYLATRQVNTVLQLLLMGSTMISPIIPLDTSHLLQWLQYVN